MNRFENNMARRFGMMLTGNLFISICVGCYRLSGMGVDAFTCLNLGISGFIGMGFGTWQLIMNVFLFVFVIIFARGLIGAGTIVNMVCVGYIADFMCWLVLDTAEINMTFALRIFMLLLGCFFSALGVAFYMEADMGLSPYDSVAPIIEKLSKNRIPFRNARVIGDITSVVTGVIFCLAGRDSLAMIIGVGTVINACFNGPLIQFFRTHVSEPMLRAKAV